MSNPCDRIAIPEGELAPFRPAPGAPGDARALLAQQKQTWDLLRTGYATLDTVRTKAFDFNGVQIKVQFNPGRMTSTLAKVDAHSIRERKCFLCPGNLPAPQRGIACDPDAGKGGVSSVPYLLLCNPFPIFPEHFTIPATDHIPQRIRGSFGAFLEFTRRFGERYTVFYNGPRCGASAPDHLHFQAGNRSFFSIESEYDRLQEAKGGCLLERDSVRAVWVADGLRRFVGLESGDPAALLRAFEVLHEALASGGAEGEEPMLNILGFYDGTWKILVFPRAKHRPAFYFAEGDDQLLISPAAVELGGVCTTPREQDFDKVSREHLSGMFEEVCFSAERFAALLARWQEALKG